MIKKNLKILTITSIIVLLPIFFGLILWNRLPQELPTHWNVNGEIDGWSSKAFVVFGFPLMMLGFHLITAFAVSADPKKQNHTEKMLTLVFWIIPIINLVLSAVIYATVMGTDILMNIVVPEILGLLFVIIGNYLPKCKQNYTIGIKIPWTLNSEENWNKTHRFAGWVWVICGIIVMLLGCFGLLWLILPPILIMAVAPMIYSYILHRKGV